MPVQQQPASNLAAKFGARLAAANAEHKDEPLDLGFRRLPPGIKDGVGKLHTVAMKVYGQDEKIVALRGQEYLHVVGVVVKPREHEGQKVEGRQMFLRFPLCDIPANPANKFSKPKSLSENFREFQQFFLRFGIKAPNETPQTDPTGARTWGYYLTAIQTLTTRIAQGGENVPHYEFTTRAWRPQGATEDRVEENWGEQCKSPGKVDPAAGVGSVPPTGNGYGGPPTQAADGMPVGPPPSPPPQRPAPQAHVAAVPPPTQPVPPTPEAEPDIADVVASLVEVAMNDSEGASEEAIEAFGRLEKMAWAAGWTEEQTQSPPEPFTNDWAGVGDMILNPPQTNAGPTNEPSSNGTPGMVGGLPNGEHLIVPGSRWKFAKRNKDGEKLKNTKGEEFPAQEVEVVTVDATAKTCTVWTIKDNKDVVDIRTKKPVAVKFEWLE